MVKSPHRFGVAARIGPGGGAHSQHDLTVHFGLGPAIWADTVVIHWPAGGVSRWTSVGADQILTVDEGSLFANGFESGGVAGWDGVEL